MAPADISARIARVELWPEFAGYGPIPGIESAHYEKHAEGMIGARIRVKNRDGSTHVEEITEWSPERRIVMTMHSFSPPLQKLADRFVEEWDFTRATDRTAVRRSFTLYPRSPLARPLLSVISKLLRRAISRHLDQMRLAAEAES